MAFLVIALNFLIRAFPRFTLKNTYVSDTYFHLYCADVIREGDFAIPEKLPRVLLPHRFTYPYLYHFLLALFPLRQRLWAERLSGAVFDTLSLIVVYLFSSWVARFEGYPNSNLPLVVSALFAFSPALLRIGSGPRAYNGSPRPFGLFLYLVHILSAWAAFKTQNAWLLLPSLISGACILFGAKFATQVLLFFSVFFGVFISPYYFLVLAGSFLVSILLTGGRVLKVLEGSIQHSTNYYLTLQKIFLYPNLRNFGFSYFEKWSTLRYLFRLPRGGRRQFIKEFLHWFYNENLPAHLFVTVFPQYLFVVYYVFLYFSFAPFDRFLLVWMVAGIFYFILTKVKPFLFLGEGERYLEFALFPSFYLFCNLFGVPPAIWIALFLYSLLSAVYYVRSYHNQFRKDNELDYYARKDIFRLHIKDERDVIMPIGSFHWLALLFSNNPVVTHGANLRTEEKDLFLKVLDRYPYPSKNYREIFAQYQVRYIVSGEAWIRKYREDIVEDAQDFDNLVEWIYVSPLFWIGKVREIIG